MMVRSILTEMSNERIKMPLIDPILSVINIVNNSQESLPSSPHSMDELVILQRGPRKVPVTMDSYTTSLETRDFSPVAELNILLLEQRINVFARITCEGLLRLQCISKTRRVTRKMMLSQILPFKRFVINQGMCLIEHRQWAMVVDYVFKAWMYVRRLLSFSSHKVVRVQCFRRLATICKVALENMKYTIDKETIVYYKKGFYKRLRDHKRSVRMCIQLLNRL